MILYRSRLVLCFSAVWLVCSLLFTVPLFASSATSQGLPEGYPENRLRVDSSALPWRTIGQLNMAGRGSCTATLVAPDWVVTAAHCLWDSEMQRWYPAEFVHFVAGFEGEDYQAHSRAKRLHINPEYRPAVPASLQGAISDWALIQLQEPLGRTIGYMPSDDLLSEDYAVGGVRAGDEREWIQAGYRQDRSYVLTVYHQCNVQRLAPLQNGRSGLIGHRCDTTAGDSGGPLLYRVGTQYYLVGIYIGRVDKSNLGLVVSVSQWRDWLIRVAGATSGR